MSLQPNSLRCVRKREYVCASVVIYYTSAECFYWREGGVEKERESLRMCAHLRHLLCLSSLARFKLYLWLVSAITGLTERGIKRVFFISMGCPISAWMDLLEEGLIKSFITLPQLD